MHRCNTAPRCRTKSKRTGLPCAAVTGYRVLPDAGGPRRRPERKKEWQHGGRTKETISASRYIKGLARRIKDNN